MKTQYDIITDYVEQFDCSLLINGHNGPYNDEETLARILAHNIVLFSCWGCLKKTLVFQSIVKQLLKELEKFKPNSCGTYICRTSSNKDLTNGLIGQAWIIEALVEAYWYLKDEELLQKAKELFLLHPFDEKKALWHCVSPDGTVLPFDMTFNHELWFAASGSLLLKATNSNSIKHEIEIFMRGLKDCFRVHGNGLIVHMLKPQNFIGKFKFYIKTIKDDFCTKIGKPSMEYKEIGYQSFNLYGFALLYQSFKDDSFFRSRRFVNALEFCNSKEYIVGLFNAVSSKDINSPKLPTCKLQCNRYGFAYNAPGFELNYIAKTFDKIHLINKSVICKIWESQINLTYNERNNKFDFNTEDSVLLNARIYELVRGLSSFNISRE